MHRLPNLLKSRHGVYYLRATRAGRQIKRSLGTKDWNRASILAHAILLRAAMSDKNPKLADILARSSGLRKAIAQHDRSEINEYIVSFPGGGRIQADGPDDHQRAMEALDRLARVAPAHSAPPASPPLEHTAGGIFKTLPLSVVYDEYLIEQACGNVRDTLDDKLATYKQFIGLFGDLAIGQVQFEQVRAFKARLIGDKLSTKRVNSKLSYLRHLFQWALDNGHLSGANVWEKAKVGNKGTMKKETESYEPFTQDELDRIFDPASYSEYAKEPHFHWIPFLALYTGARLEELASLELNKIQCQEGIHFLRFADGKNAASAKRWIPLHRVVEDSGFLAYVHAMKDEGHERVFPKLAKTKNGYGKNITRRFNEIYLRKLGIDAKTKKLYSFRATFINRLTEKNVHAGMLMALVGHYEQAQVDLSSPHFQNYQQAKLLRALKETIDLYDVTVPMRF